ncbi:MAG TPA: mechanosensitive ion channel domain-containing protein [Candidatus Deferrimicrobiaceae bacterium]|nr:mechanosensitive ion channel domain-containing protein [Candidatus Deferrimicrobiaceae bacterium]
MKLTTGNRLLILLGVAIVGLLGIGFLASEAILPLFGSLRADLQKALYRPYFTVGDLPVTPVFLIKTFVFFFLLRIVSRMSRRLMEKRVLVRTSLNAGQQYAWAQITGYLVFLFGLLIGLQWAGVNMSSLVILGGAIGIGVGFGLQNIANNFVSGLILLMERPIQVGDRVEVGDTNGDVVRIAGRSTWIRTNDNVVMIIPNSEFINSHVTNWTANDRQVRFAIPLGVSYGSDPEFVRQVLEEVAGRHPDVLTIPPPEVLFTGFGDSSLDFELRVWTISRVQFPRILASEIYFMIFKAFKEHGIEIPFPQRDLHLKSVSVPIPVSSAG